jgi:hypothetical protein
MLMLNSCPSASGWVIAAITAEAELRLSYDHPPVQRKVDLHRSMSKTTGIGIQI